MRFLRISDCYAPIIALVLACSCNGQTGTSITLTFEGLQDQEPVSNYYNGGLGGFGSGPGPNDGIIFGPDAIAAIAMSAGGSGYFSENPSGVTIVSFLSGPGVVMNVPGGFTTGFSFYYASGTSTGTVTVYDGPNATGNILGTVPLAATGAYCDPSWQYSCWTTQGVSFSGIAQSADFSGATNGIGFDNITIGSQTPGSGNPTPPTGPILTVTPSVSGSTTTLIPEILSQTVTVTNSGASGSFTASITPSCPVSSTLVPSPCPAAGITIQPTSGTIGGAGSTTNLTVSFNTAGVPPGVYTATYTVSAFNNDDFRAGGLPIPRNVAPRPRSSPNSGPATETVNGVLQAGPQKLTFNLTDAQPQQTQTFTLSEASSNGFIVPFNAKYSPQQTGPSVEVSPMSGGDTPEMVSVTASAGTLGPGQTATGTLGLTCTNAPCSPPALNIPVSITAPGPQSITRVIPDFGAGASFVTDFYVINSGSSNANFSINFYNGSGDPVAVPFGSLGSIFTLADTIPAGGAGFYEAGTPDTNPAIFGSGIVTSDPSITIQAVLRRLGSDGSYYEAAVPAEIASNEIEVPFDATIFSGNNSQIYTGLAIVNTDPANPATVNCTARDSGGTAINGAISVGQMAPLGQFAAYMFPAVEGQRGTFDCTSNTLIGAIATLALGTNALSTLPVFSQ
jgi:hypothetical protein